MQALIHRCHHYTCEHAAYLSDSCEDSCPFRNFQRLVPGPKDVDSATVQTRLKETLEESNYAQLRVSLTGCTAHRETRPY
jgi:hypothetical protein